MDMKIAGVLGAVTAFAAASPALAMPNAVDLDSAMQASSYADLLKPIPNAAALLKVSDARDAEAALLAPAVEGDATIEQVQFYHHHHHHHHYGYGFGPRFLPRFHHHHHGFYPRFYHHHHHFHHHHQYFRGDGY